MYSQSDATKFQSDDRILSYNQ